MQQRLIVEVCQGRDKYLKAAIAPGERLRVGRTDRADLVLPHDGKLSGLHFELGWDGQQATVRDHNSQAGTLLDGEPLPEGAEVKVPHGSWIRAGQSDLQVFREAHTPRRLDAPVDDSPEARLTRKQALAGLREAAAQHKLYAVLDAARGGRILELVRESVEHYRSLYDGVQGEALAQAAPHLVALPAESRLLEALVEEGWRQRWGVYLSSSRPFDAVRRHLRRFLMVELEDKPEPLYFRYYDPHVMAVLLASITVRQRHSFMEELEAILFEDRRDGSLTRVEARPA